MFSLPFSNLSLSLSRFILPRLQFVCVSGIFIYRSYLILGKDIESPSGTIGIGPRSIVIEWKDEWYQRMKRFQRRDHACG